MVSKKEVAAAFNAAAEALGVDGDELGDLLFTLSELSEEKLDFFPIGADNKAVVAFARSARASAAGLRVGSAAGAGASTSAPAAEHLRGQQGDSAMDALLVKVAKAAGAATKAAAAAKATVKALKPVLKPLLQHAYGPRSSSSAQSEYRPAALKHYTGETQPQHATCAVSGVRLPVKDVIAGHIYQKRWPPTNDVDINDPSNILLMHRKVEQLFDNLVITVTPVGLKVVVLHKANTERVLFEYEDDGGHQRSVKLSDLDGRLLALGPGTAPSQYALRVHASWAFDHALQQRWCKAADIPPIVRCDRELFQAYLLDSASSSSSGGGIGGGGSRGGSRGGSGGGNGVGSGQDTNIPGEAGATGEVGLSSSGGSRGSAGASDKAESDLAVAAQQQLKL